MSKYSQTLIDSAIETLKEVYNVAHSEDEDYAPVNPVIAVSGDFIGVDSGLFDDDRTMAMEHAETFVASGDKNISEECAIAFLDMFFEDND